MGLENWGTTLEENLVEARSNAGTLIVRRTWAWARKTNRTIWKLVPYEVSLKIAGAKTMPGTVGKAKDERHRRRNSFDHFSHF